MAMIQEIVLNPCSGHVAVCHLLSVFVTKMVLCPMVSDLFKRKYVEAQSHISFKVARLFQQVTVYADTGIEYNDNSDA